MDELTALSADPGLWNDAEKAQKLMSEKTNLETSLNNFQEMQTALNDLCDLAELAEAEGDETVVADCLEQLAQLREQTKRGELEALLSGEVDGNDAFLEVHSGSGGTEAQDWAEMLLRMYSRWAEDHKYKVEYVEETEGDVAGLKSATIKICGHNAYGWLKSESGVHRLVRISPFDSNARRHTSFASVWVYPVIDDEINIEITRNIAERFNGIYGNVFKIPDGFIPKNGARVMSLQDPTRKMSKSDENVNGCVHLLDAPEVIMKKFKRAVTDSEAKVRYAEGKDGVNNLMAIYSAVTGLSYEQIEKDFDGKGYGDFKTAVGEAVVEELRPIRERYEKLVADKAYLESCYRKADEIALKISSRTMGKVMKKIGFI